MIKFLSTRSYTYILDPQAADAEAEIAEIPVSDVAQGSFQVAFYATVSKYDCEKLVQSALTYVLRQLKGLDVIQLWKAVYLKGLYLSQFETDGDFQPFIRGLQQLVGDAYKTHREEMDSIVSEYPALASDHLRLVTTGGGG